jgi:hypothetical protein
MPPFRRRSEASLPFAITLVLSLVLPSAAPHLKLEADRAAEIGIAVQRLDQRSIAQVADLGLRHIRYTLYWSLWSQANYRRDWERSLQLALQAGLDPLVVVHQSPAGDFSSRNMVYRSFAEFMEARAAEFPRVRAWQLWNEMDVGFTDLFGAGRSGISMRQRGHYYAEMLKLAYPAIKRGNPKALVVTGGLASAIDGGFLEGMYDQQAPYDVLAIHTYGFPLALPFQSRGRTAWRIRQDHADQRPMWNTEFGLERAVIPGNWRLTPAQIDSAQLEAWRTSVEGNARDHLYDRIYGYVLAEGKDLGFDLIRVDGSPRPAYLWLRSWCLGSAR